MRIIRNYEMFGTRKKKQTPTPAPKPPAPPPEHLKLAGRVGRSLIDDCALLLRTNRVPTDQELASIGAYVEQWAPTPEDAQHLRKLDCRRCRHRHEQHLNGACPNGAGEFVS